MSRDARTLLVVSSAQSSSTQLAISRNRGASFDVVAIPNAGPTGFVGAGLSEDGTVAFAASRGAVGSPFFRAMLRDARLLEPSVRTKQVRLGGIDGALPASAAQVSVGGVDAQDMECGGQGCIFGTVEQKLTGDATLPLKRRVRLHRSRDGMLVRETWSDENGHYRFDGLSTRYEYDVIAWDHEGQFRSTIANNLKPEVLP